MYCESDQETLCWVCDERVHNANFLVAKHTRRLVCQVYGSPTPWADAGQNLSPTVLVCNDCSDHHRRDPVVGHQEEEEYNVNDDGIGGSDEEEDDEGSVDSDDFDGEDNEEEEKEDDEENQVMPWSCASPPAQAASSSSSGEELAAISRLGPPIADVASQWVGKVGRNEASRMLTRREVCHIGSPGHYLD